MLIVPLHRPPTWANVPWITLALILVNLFVFCGPQSGDERARSDALDDYARSGLASTEFPAYRDWLAALAGRDAQAERFEAAARVDASAAVLLMQSDTVFITELDAGRVILPASDGFAAWRERREAFEQRWNAIFTERWALRFSDVDPRRIFGAMFLHGSAGHLIGNMVFLAVLGLLVEGALGPGWFLALYLLGGLGSALGSLAWRWGESGQALGASGAIAALMGAYCVLWGRRKVRFFWWFLVAFDYVRAPALVLLPFWLGWELLNLFFNRGANVAFDAHASGIVTGAVLALVLRTLGVERRGYLDEDVVADAAADDRAALARAHVHIGRLEIAAARALLEPVFERQPQDFDVRVALYRCARYEPGQPHLDAAARSVLTFAASARQAHEQKAVFDDYRKAARRRLPLTATQLVQLSARWPAIGAGDEASALVTTIITRAPDTPGLAPAALALARSLGAGSKEASSPLLRAIERAWPDSVEAGKARLLLADIG